MSHPEDNSGSVTGGNITRFQRPKLPGWANVGALAPDSLRQAFSKIPFEAETSYWSSEERRALSLLLQCPEMQQVYSHLKSFSLEPQEWRSIFIDVLAGSYSATMKSLESNSEIEAMNCYAQNVALTAYELYELLSGIELFPSLRGKHPNNQEHFFHELLGIVASCTSATWPQQYSEWWSNPERNIDEIEEISKIRHKETPEFDPTFNLDESSTSTRREFPAPFSIDTLPTKKFTQFIQTALTKFDDLSSDFNRDFSIIRSGNREIAREDGYIFLEPQHWRVICALLFGSDEKKDDKDTYQNRTINSVIKRHRTKSNYYS